jgi:radical SAM protein with 4Fe4S-binding SPASM domain
MVALVRYAKIAYRWQLERNAVLDYVPEDISIEVTNTCNFKCQFCPQSSPSHFVGRERTNLSAEQADQLLAKLRRGGVTTSLIHWTLDGEPFVNKSFHRICERGLAHGFRTQVFSTNGSLATHTRVSELPRSPSAKYTLCIDFCADERYFEEVRGNPGSWSKVLANICEVLADAELAHLNIKVTDISSYGFDDPEELTRRRGALVALLPDSPRLKVAGRVFHNMTGYVPLNRLKKKLTQRRYYLCPYPWMSLVVASNGDVVACCRDLSHKTVLGNLFAQELAEIWNGKPYQQLRQQLAARNPDSVSACKGCDLPFDTSKFGAKNLVRAAVNRFKVFAR